jgi:hypothetical protein
MSSASLFQPDPISDARPAERSRDALLRRLVSSAVLAPSSHNTQPWLFRIDDDVVEVRADRTRALPVVDPFDRALVMSCGAALGVLRTASRAEGYLPDIARLPVAVDRDLLARVRLGGPYVPTAEERARADAIPRRHTNRRPFAPRAVPPELIERMRQLARIEGVWLRPVVTSDEKYAVADLVAEGDRAQATDPAFRRELAAWLHPNRSHSGDGMPGLAFGVGDLASIPFPWVIRTFDWGNGQAAKDRQLALGSPALLLLGTESDDERSWLQAGEALALLLLQATAAGLEASFLNQAIEVPHVRPKLGRVLGLHGPPQLLLRVGYGVDVPATPRRPLAEVLIA